MVSRRYSARRHVNHIFTALKLRNKGFYTPYDYLKGVPSEAAAYPSMVELFDSKVPTFSKFLSCIDKQEDKFLQSRSGSPGLTWESRWISKLDGAAIYTAVGLNAPKRIIEIGSGNSTHFLCRAVADQGLKTNIVCIDPHPRIDVTHLDVDFLRRPLLMDDVELLVTLQPNDILFIDSSHILQPNFDVDILFNRVFPVLRSGVVVHVHDVFLPYSYPDSWFEYRFNEQNALIPWLISGLFDVDFASHYVWRCMKSELNQICPRFPLDTPDNGGSLWIRRQ